LDFTLQDLFNTLDIPFEPKIFYDTQSGRWFASATTFATAKAFCVEPIATRKIIPASTGFTNFECPKLCPINVHNKLFKNL